MNGRQHPIHLRVHLAACRICGIALSRLRKRRIPENASFAKLHHIEHGADNITVFAQVQHIRHRYIGVFQRGHNTEFAIHRMGGLEQFARRLTAQHIGARGGRNLEGRVGLPPLKFLRFNGTLEARDMLLKILSQFLCIYLGHGTLLLFFFFLLRKKQHPERD